MKRVVWVSVAVVVGTGLMGPPAFGKCGKDCKRAISAEAKACRSACLKGTAGKACKKACKDEKKADMATCKAATSPTPPLCGETTTTSTTTTTTTSTTIATTTTTTITLPSCNAVGGACGSCGSGICANHCGIPGAPLVCWNNSSFNNPGCATDAACPAGYFCAAGGASFCGTGTANGCVTTCP